MLRPRPSSRHGGFFDKVELVTTRQRKPKGYNVVSLFVQKMLNHVGCPDRRAQK